MKRKVVRWGLVGTGDIARKRVAAALQALKPYGNLQGVASRTAKGAAEFASAHGIERVYPDPEALFADRSIDAVYIAAPVHLHAALTVSAARAGKHVLCEKPMALNFRECQAMIRACRRAGVTLGIAYYRRFYPVVRKLKELLQEGAIGKPVLVRALVAERFNPEGREAPRRWLVQRKRSGGGPMMDFGCHRLDLMIYLLGPIRSVRAETRNLKFWRRDVEDHATAVLCFEGEKKRRQGLLGTITASHCMGSGEDEFAIYGTEGKLHCHNLGLGEIRAETRRGSKTLVLPPPQNLHYPLIEDFNRAVLEKREPLITGEDGAETSRVLDRFYGRT